MMPISLDVAGFKNYFDKKRIGDATANLSDDLHKKLLNFEKVIKEESHLSTQYDTCSPQSSYYPQLLFYSYISRFVCVSTNSPEFNVRFIERELSDLKWKDCNLEYDDVFKNSEKYKSYDFDTKQKIGSVFFTSGDNFKFAADQERLFELMEYNEDMLIKPHPICSEGDIFDYGMAFGFDRVIEPECSGDQVMNVSKKVYYVDSSEYGLKAMLKGVPNDHLNKPFFAPGLPYHHLYNNLRRYGAEDQKKMVAYIMSNSNFGFFDINNSLDELRDQYKSFLQKIEKLRKEMKPRNSRFNIEDFYKEKQKLCDCEHCKDKRDSTDEE